MAEFVVTIGRFGKNLEIKESFLVMTSDMGTTEQELQKIVWFTISAEYELLSIAANSHSQDKFQQQVMQSPCDAKCLVIPRNLTRKL